MSDGVAWAGNPPGYPIRSKLMVISVGILESMDAASHRDKSVMRLVGARQS